MNVLCWFVDQLERFGRAALHNITAPDDVDWPACEWCGEEATCKVGREGGQHYACFDCGRAYLGAA